MRIIVLGPIINSRSSGGVAVFDEGICQGFRELGDFCNIISIDKSDKIDNIVAGKPNRSPKTIFFRFSKIAKLIRSFKPDIVISSLQYSIGIKKYKRYWRSAKYIQILHGMPCPINGKFKSWCINFVARYSKKYFDKVVTVSYLSYAINKKINLITCDKVIHNGCALSPSLKRKKDIDIIYIGRLFRDKEVEMIGDSFIELLKKDCSLKLCVAGYGELDNLFTNGKYKNSGIEFLGKKTQEEVSELLARSKFFISMNPLEPFGIVFCEALVNGCNIITQSTSGSASLFAKESFFHVADCCNFVDLAEQLDKILKRYVEIKDEKIVEFKKYFSYKRCASEYKKLFYD